jgi:DNA-binding CsgD family transcriptional regulator
MPKTKRPSGKLSTSDYASVLDCLLEISSEDNPAQFPPRLLKAISRLVKAKSIGFTEVDPVLGKSTVHFFPPMPSEAIAEAFQRNIHDHPVVNAVATTRDGRAKAISDFITADAFRRTGLYREVFKPLGLIDQLSIAMVGSAGLMIGISFNRAKCGFSKRDRDVLNLIRPHLLQAYLNCRERLALETRSGDRHAAIIDQLPVGLICVSAGGRISWATSIAMTILRNHYSDAADSIHGLPDAVRHWLKRSSSAANRAENATPQLVSGRPGFKLRIRLCPLKDGRVILLAQESPAIDQQPSIQNFNFTGRERQVAEQISAGNSAAQVAANLEISPRTAQKHLERIFRKLDVNNLASACVKLLRSS